MRALLICFLVLSGAAQHAAAQAGKLYPVDEADQDPSFLVFRLRIVEAIAARDTAFVYAHLSPDIKNSFGGDAGIAAFKAMWRPSDPQSELWSTRAKVIGGGGPYAGQPVVTGQGDTLSTAQFEAPYWSAAFPAQGYDPFDYGVVVGEQVRVRRQPAPTSAVLAQLSFELVRVVDFYPHLHQGQAGYAPGWVQVELAGGETGFVAEAYIGMAVGYRARFEKVAGRWLMTLLLAGD